MDNNKKKNRNKDFNFSDTEENQQPAPSVDAKSQDEISVADVNAENDIKVEETENIQEEIENEEDNVKFIIGKKKENKDERKQIHVYMDPKKIDELDKVVKKTNHNRSDIINMMIDFCLENIEYRK